MSGGIKSQVQNTVDEIDITLCVLRRVLCYLCH